MRPDLPDKMPIELREELETIKQNEFGIVNFKDNTNDENRKRDNNMSRTKKSGRGHNLYREEYSPIF